MDSPTLFPIGCLHYPSRLPRVSWRWLCVGTLLLGLVNRPVCGEELVVTEAERFAEIQDLSSTGDQLLQLEVPESDFSVTIKSLVSPSENPELLSIPLLDGFTTNHCFRLSDMNSVVGFATRTLGHPDGSQRAFVWNWRKGQLETLPTPDGFRGGCAFDISADGTLASGLLVGRSPARILPCVWQLRDNEWQCETLPTDALYNPFLSTARVAVSDDGRFVAASVARSDKIGTGNQLRIWTKDGRGRWRGRNATDFGVHIANINNQGMVVGRVTRRGIRIGFVFHPEDGEILFEPLAGDASTAALDVNNHGVVVGNSDDPPGPDGGSTAFVWQRGDADLQEIKYPRDAIFSSAQTIDDRGRVAGWLTWRADGDIKSGSYVLELTSAQK